MRTHIDSTRLFIPMCLFAIGMPGCSIYVGDSAGREGLTSEEESSPAHGSAPEAPAQVPASGDGHADGVGQNHGGTLLSEVGTLVEVFDFGEPTAGRDVRDRGNATGAHGCSSGDLLYGHYENPTLSTQLHIVSVYTPDDSGTIDVHVNRPGPMQLVLSAYDAAHWEVTAAPEVELLKVVINGYHAQSAAVPAGVPVERYTYEQDGALLGDTAYTWPSIDATNLADAAEAKTGLVTTSFRSCYESNHFQVDEPDTIAPPTLVSDAPEPNVIPGCEHIAEESTYCLALNGFFNELAMVGLDSGASCAGPPIAGYIELFLSSSLGWRGDYAYVCDYSRGMARISLVDGSLEVAPVNCTTVTSTADSLWAVSTANGESNGLDPAVTRFADFGHAAKRYGSQMFLFHEPLGAVAVQGDRVYGKSIFSNSEIYVADLEDGAPITSLPLQGYEGSIDALDVATNDTVIVGGSWLDSGIHVFDATTGGHLHSVDAEIAEFGLGGIKCVVNPSSR